MSSRTSARPKLMLILGGTPREAAYATTVGDDVVRFEYVVQAGDQDLDGILFMNNAIVWNDGAIIRKVHGDVVDLNQLKLLRVADNGGSTFTHALPDHRVNALVSTDATLGGLILDELDRTEIALSPAFASTTTSYTASVPNSVDKITIDLTTNDSRATVAPVSTSSGHR